MALRTMKTQGLLLLLMEEAERVKVGRNPDKSDWNAVNSDASAKWRRLANVKRVNPHDHHDRDLYACGAQAS